MNLHQVTADGAGPMTCFVDPTAAGTAFQAMKVTTNVPGNNGNSNAANVDFPLVAQMPAGVACTGTVAGVNNLCMVKCQNPVGPFGGTVAVQSSGSATAGNATTPAAGVAATGSTGVAVAKAGTGSTESAAKKAPTGTTGKKGEKKGKKGERKGAKKGTMAKKAKHGMKKAARRAGNAVRARALLHVGDE